MDRVYLCTDEANLGTIELAYVLETATKIKEGRSVFRPGAPIDSAVKGRVNWIPL